MKKIIWVILSVFVISLVSVIGTRYYKSYQNKRKIEIKRADSIAQVKKDSLAYIAHEDSTKNVLIIKYENIATYDFYNWYYMVVFKNVSGRTIKYIDFIVMFANKLNEPVIHDGKSKRDDVIKSSVKLQYTGPVKPNQTVRYSWGEVFRNGNVKAAATYMANITFSDDTELVIDNPKNMMESTNK